jgi:hypothetical protein
MSAIQRMKTHLAALSVVCLLVCGPAQAGYLDFSADSLRAEETGGC